MTLRGAQCHIMYSGATNSDVAQSNPLISLGGARPANGILDPAVLLSAPYREEALDSTRTLLNEVQDTQTDTASSTDPAPGDWLSIVSGAACPYHGRVQAVNYSTGVITLDRPVSVAPVSTDLIRTARAQNVFPNVTLAQIQAGLVDYRMLYFIKNDAGSENNFRFWCEPVTPNGCDIEILVGSDVLIDADPGLVTALLLLASGTESPLTSFGGLRTPNAGFDLAEAFSPTYSALNVRPRNGSPVIADESSIPIFFRRTIPQHANPGECVFVLHIVVPNAVAQDATANPATFDLRIPIVWTNPEPAYRLRIFSDRILTTRGSAEIIGEVLYPDGTPAVGLNALLTKTAGVGTFTPDLDAKTDARGRVTSVYTGPATLGADPAFLLTVPTSLRV